MSAAKASLDHALQGAFRWLTAHAGFPARRLPGKAELLVLLAAAATDAIPVPTSPQRFSDAGSLRASTDIRVRDYALRRKHAHRKSDNSAKV